MLAAMEDNSYHLDWFTGN